MIAQLAFSLFDDLPAGFMPISRKRPRRAKQAVPEAFVKSAQYSFIDILAMHEEDFEPVIWTDEDFEIVRNGVLREACHVLLDLRCSLVTRRDRWAWINSDAWAPFSFRACAASEEVNHEDLRTCLIYLMRHHNVLHLLQAA